MEPCITVAQLPAFIVVLPTIANVIAVFSRMEPRLCVKNSRKLPSFLVAKMGREGTFSVLSFKLNASAHN